MTVNRRYLFILLGILLFLPPWSPLPQLVGEVNMCGTVCPRMFYIFSRGGIWAGLLTGIKAMWFGALLVSLVLTVTLFCGRLWCSHCCPVGGATELVNCGLPAWCKLNWTFIDAPAFRYGYLFVFMAGAVVGIGAISCKLCNFRVIPFLVGAPFVPAYQTYLQSSMGLAGLLTITLTGFLARGGRGYCNLLCPVGALDSMVNYLGAKLPFARRMITDRSRCNGCGRCVESCMVWALRHDGEQGVARSQLSCLACRECAKVCPRGAIRYGRR